MSQTYITNNVRAKIDRTAYAIALMEIGRYEFPDGKQKFSKSESGIRVHRVVKDEAQRYGWGITEDGRYGSRATYYDLFNPKGKYYELLKERTANHRMRLSEGYASELAKLTDDGRALTKLSKLLYESLMDDLSDPERAKGIAFKDRAMLYEKVTKLEAQVHGDAATKPPQPAIQAHTVIGTLNLPDSVRGDVVDRLMTIEGTVEPE